METFMTRHPRFTVRGLFLFAGFCLFASGIAQQVQLNDIGTLGNNTVAKGVNDSGEVLATSNNGSANEMVTYTTQGGLINLGGLGESSSITPTGINDNGVIVGYYSPSSNNFQPFYYNGNFSEPTISGINYSSAYFQGINANGLIVGNAQGSPEQAFTYQIGNGSVNGYLGSYTTTHGYGINNSGDIAGTVGLANGTTEGGVYSASSSSWTTIGILTGGNSSNGAAINNSGEVVGSSTIQVGNEIDTHAVSFFANQLHDLGTIVGSVRNSLTGASHGFYYDGHSMIDLNSLLGSNYPDYTITNAVAISANGEYISADATLSNGAQRAVLLTVTPQAAPEPSMFILAGGVVSFAFMKRLRPSL